MRKLVVVLSLLLFEPIVIDQTTFDGLMQGAYSNMRGTEYDWFKAVMGQLEQRAMQQKKPAEAPKAEPTPNK